MDVKKQIDYWLKSAKSDLEIAQLVFDSGKNLHHCLFLCHLILEKGLKALVVKRTKKVPPRIHNLPLLVELANLELHDSESAFLVEINVFNIEGRYPDEQFKVYQRATKEYTQKLFAKTKDQFRWIEKRARQSK